MKMQIEEVAVADLIPYARNARTHSPAQVLQLANSITEFGFCNPVLIDQDNGIVAGHGRVLAARHLGWERLPCVRLAHLTDLQRRAYVLADNRLALSATWDEAMLALELAELREEGFDLSLSGFEEEMVERLLNGPESAAQEIDADEYEMTYRCEHCGFEFNAN